MNNVIVILMDSVYSECLGTGRTEKTSTPFLDKLKKEGIFIPNMYSFGPFTNAATKGLFCSTQTLNDYGYYFGINASKYNHFKVFKESGYETYGFYYPYYLISKENTKNIDHSIYTSGFVFKSVWRGNFEYYSEIIKERGLNSEEYSLLIHFLEMMFGCWIEYYENMIKIPETTVMLDEYIDITLVKVSLDRLKYQYILFQENLENYINGVLSLGMNHELAKIDCVDVGEFVDKKFLQDVVYVRNKNKIKYIQKRTKTLNKKNNKISVKRSLNSIINFIKTRNKNELRYLYNCYCSRNTQNKMIRDSFNGIWQEMPSAKTQIRAGIEKLSKRGNDDIPFYMFFHILDAHERVSYFSYDQKDVDVIDKEFEMAYNVAKGCGSKFKGSLVYQMSLRYIDSCIEELYTYLERKNILDKTTIMVLSDHGSSYSYFPLRNDVVNNFHKENYNIPTIIWQKRNNYNHQYNGLYTSMDAFPTLIELVNINKPKEFLGKAVWDLPEGRDFVITEYMGPGCPDMLTKDVWLSIRDKKYMIAYKTKINESFSRNDIFEAYCLEEDQYELRNIAKIIDVNNKEVAFLINKIEERFIEICTHRDEFIMRLNQK